MSKVLPGPGMTWTVVVYIIICQILTIIGVGAHTRPARRAFFSGPAW
jgi:hypothetical protein